MLMPCASDLDIFAQAEAERNGFIQAWTAGYELYPQQFTLYVYTQKVTYNQDFEVPEITGDECLDDEDLWRITVQKAFRLLFRNHPELLIHDL